MNEWPEKFDKDNYPEFRTIAECGICHDDPFIRDPRQEANNSAICLRLTGWDQKKNEEYKREFAVCYSDLLESLITGKRNHGIGCPVCGHDDCARIDVSKYRKLEDGIVAWKVACSYGWISTTYFMQEEYERMALTVLYEVIQKGHYEGTDNFIYDPLAMYRNLERLFRERRDLLAVWQDIATKDAEEMNRRLAENHWLVISPQRGEERFIWKAAPSMTVPFDIYSATPVPKTKFYKLGIDPHLGDDLAEWANVPLWRGERKSSCVNLRGNYESSYAWGLHLAKTLEREVGDKFNIAYLGTRII